MSVRKKLTELEVAFAFVIGGGLTLLIVGYGLAAAQAGVPGFDASRLNAVMVIGAGLAVFGFIGWLLTVRPWKNFDDWSQPLYTGHDHHDDHAADHGAADHGEEHHAPSSSH